MVVEQVARCLLLRPVTDSSPDAEDSMMLALQIQFLADTCIAVLAGNSLEQLVYLPMARSLPGRMERCYVVAAEVEAAQSVGRSLTCCVPWRQRLDYVVIEPAEGADIGKAR